jgi:hypothetical protein
VREPVGVVGAITPWNYPLYQVVLKVAPALAAGCTVVLKPSEVAPINAFILAEVIDEVGLPAGVFNLVTGVGPVVGEAIAAHPKVDMVSFTGSTRAGKRVMELAPRASSGSRSSWAASRPTSCSTTPTSAAVPAGLFACYMNSGQTCSALTRMLVPRDKLAEVEELARRRRRGFAPGDPFEAGKLLGPLVSAVQRDRVRGYINKGIEEGAKLVTGGAEAPEGLEKGFFVQPTVFSEVTPDMTIAKEEIFGPVLSIIPYDTEEEAIEIANDTPYGLAGGGVERRPGPGREGGPPDAHRSGRHQRWRLQPQRALRRLQAVGHRPRARQVRPRGVRRDQVDAALYDEAVVNAAIHELKQQRLARSVLALARAQCGAFPPRGRTRRSASTPANARCLAVLLLRGPQTPGELRTRTERMADFERAGRRGRASCTVPGHPPGGTGRQRWAGSRARKRSAGPAPWWRAQGHGPMTGRLPMTVTRPSLSTRARLHSAPSPSSIPTLHRSDHPDQWSRTGHPRTRCSRSMTSGPRWPSSRPRSVT